MPSRTLSKVHKHISKKRGVVDSLHENSRDARRLRRAGHRDDRLSRHTSITMRARQPYGQCLETMGFLVTYEILTCNSRPH